MILLFATHDAHKYFLLHLNIAIIFIRFYLSSASNNFFFRVMSPPRHSFPHRDILRYGGYAPSLNFTPIAACMITSYCCRSCFLIAMQLPCHDLLPPYDDIQRARLGELFSNKSTRTIFAASGATQRNQTMHNRCFWTLLRRTNRLQSLAKAIYISK